MIKSQRSKRRKIKHELNYTSQTLFFNNASKSEVNLNSVPFNLSIDNGSPSHLPTNKDKIELLEKTSMITTPNYNSMSLNNEYIPSENAELFSNEINSFVNSNSVEFSIKDFSSLGH